MKLQDVIRKLKLGKDRSYWKEVGLVGLASLSLMAGNALAQAQPTQHTQQFGGGLIGTNQASNSLDLYLPQEAIIDSIQFFARDDQGNGATAQLQVSVDNQILTASAQIPSNGVESNIQGLGFTGQHIQLYDLTGDEVEIANVTVNYHAAFGPPPPPPPPPYNPGPQVQQFAGGTIGSGGQTALNVYLSSPSYVMYVEFAASGSGYTSVVNVLVDNQSVQNGIQLSPNDNVTHVNANNMFGSQITISSLNGQMARIDYVRVGFQSANLNQGPLSPPPFGRVLGGGFFGH